MEYGVIKAIDDLCRDSKLRILTDRGKYIVIADSKIGNFSMDAEHENLATALNILTQKCKQYRRPEYQ